MRKPVVARAMRAGFLLQLLAVRECDCCWPRRDAFRPRCGRCFACDRLCALEIGRARVH